MKSKTCVIIGFIILSFVIISCSASLQANLINKTIYKTGDGQFIKVEYYELEDNSLSFVKINIPDVSGLTLPRVFSGSGDKYTDDAAFIWWAKGDGGTLFRINDSGGWDKLYADCKLIK